MDFYANIHKSRGDRGSSITASSDTFPPSIIQPEEEGIRKHTAEAALRAEAARERIGVGEGDRELARGSIICWKCLSLLLE